MPDFDDDSRKPVTAARRLRFLCEYLLVAGWTFGLRLLPRPAAVLWGTVIGSIAYVALWADRRVAMANLDVIFGSRKSVAFKRELALQAFQRVGEVVMGLLWAPRLTAKAAAALVDTTDLCDILRKLDADRRGSIIVTPHYGDWELGCIAVGFAGFPTISVAEPLANDRLDRLFTACRTHCGNGIIPPKYALLKLMRALRAGRRVGMLCDVNGRRGRGGVWNDFFGLQVYNAVAIAELARRTNAAIVFVVIDPIEHGRHRIVPMLVEPDWRGDRAQSVRMVMQQLTDLVADQVRRKPAPWLWTYKRWKRRPTPAQENYPRYSNNKRVE